MGCDQVVGLRMMRCSTCLVGKHRGQASECMGWDWPRRSAVVGNVGAPICGLEGGRVRHDGAHSQGGQGPGWNTKRVCV